MSAQDEMNKTRIIIPEDGGIYIPYTDVTTMNQYHNIYANNLDRNITKLNRFHMAFPDAQIDGMIGHIFFTKPDLHLFDTSKSLSVPREEIQNIAEFHDLLNFNLSIFPTLQDSASGKPLINQLCNMVKNFTQKDRIIKTRDSAETANDWKVVYGHRINDSKASDTIDFTFSDDRNLIVYKTLNLWVNYISLIGLGYITPSDSNRSNRILDYASSIYFFLTSEDGETILQYVKLIGAFPTNIPDSSFSFEFGTQKQIEYNVTFQYSIKDTSPLVIKDFNNLFSAPESYLSPVNDMGTADITWCSGVHIEEHDKCYKLKYF